MRALENMDPETLKRILSDVRSSACYTKRRGFHTTPAHAIAMTSQTPQCC